VSQVLHAKIATVRSKQTTLEAVRGLCAMAAAGVLLLAATMLLDWFVELPFWARAALLAIDVTVLAFIFLRYVVHPFVFGPDDEEIALLVEHHRPEFRTRLIASIQLARPHAVPAGASRGLVRAMIDQTERLAEPMNFADVVRADVTLKKAALASLIVVLCVAAWAYTREISGDLLKRALLANIPVPRNTRVTDVSKELTVAIGDPVSLEAIAHGEIPASGTVRIAHESGRKSQFAVEPVAEDRSRFARTIENVQESFQYRIQLNDGHGQWWKVHALPRPTVVAAAFIQNYPAYAGLAPMRKSPGDLSLLAGSRLEVKVRASKKVASGHLRLVGLDRDVDLTVDLADASQLTGSFDIPPRGLLGLSIHLKDEHGIASRGETVYAIEVVQDNPPKVQITWPDRKEELATQQAKALIAFEASDDYGVDKVLLKYVVEAQDPTERTVELDLSGERQKARGQNGSQVLRNLRLRHEFDLATIRPGLVQGSIVEYWLEVLDANNVSGPGKAVSDRYKLKVVSETEKREDLMNRLNDQLGSVDVLTQDQEKLEQRLGALVLEKQQPEQK
jgi:hypothetical protein